MAHELQFGLAANIGQIFQNFLNGRVRCRESEPLGKVTVKCTFSCVQGAKLKKSFRSCSCVPRAGGRWRGQREGRDMCQCKTSFCWHPESWRQVWASPLPPAAGKEQAPRHMSLRAAECMQPHSTCYSMSCRWMAQ